MAAHFPDSGALRNSRKRRRLAKFHSSEITRPSLTGGSFCLSDAVVVASTELCDASLIFQMATTPWGHQREAAASEGTLRFSRCRLEVGRHRMLPANCRRRHDSIARAPLAATREA